MTTKFNKSLLAATVIFGLSTQAYAADQGHGQVKFEGTIIDAPCSISPDSIDQTVPMGQISTTELENPNGTTRVPFEIKLEKCSFGEDQAKNKVTVTFTGIEAPGGNGLLGIMGDASGAGIALTQGNGKPIALGTPTTEMELQDGGNTLTFGAYMMADGASATITQGAFTAVADFTMAYN